MKEDVTSGRTNEDQTGEDETPVGWSQRGSLRLVENGWVTDERRSGIRKLPIRGLQEEKPVVVGREPPAVGGK